jgi:hypothetical protein
MRKAMPVSADDVRRTVAEALGASHFFFDRALQLEWDHAVAEEVSWEVFRGRLLDPAHTRQKRDFKSWNIYLREGGDRASQPVLSVKWDAARDELHVVRAVLSYVHEGYDAGGNVILTREVRKWVRELVGTVPLREPGRTPGEVRDLLFRAVVGTSRLPLTSLEAPLPAFTLGRLGYFPQEAGGSRLEDVKRLELLLRATPAGEIPATAPLLSQRGDAPVVALVRSLFNEVSLSPYTDFVAKALRFLECLRQDGSLTTAEYVDLLGHLLRQTGRHLTAYDLVQFHHAGANYPDALLLDEVLRAYLRAIEAHPALFTSAASDDEAEARRKCLRRRALRQAWLVRRRYQGHAVPDEPTSPGENARVLPAPHVRVPEEQILQPHRRTRRLFDDDLPACGLGERAVAVLREAVRDLSHPHELRELGMALYLDRPLGAFKASGEPDRTPLLSYTAFSRSLATQRLLLLGQDRDVLPEDELASLQQALAALPVSGVPLADVRSSARPGVVSLADAARAAADFVFLRTTSSSTRDFLGLFELAPVAERLGMPDLTRRPWLILGGPEQGEIILTFCEPDGLRKRLELGADPGEGFETRAAVEYPAKGLRVRRWWEERDGEWYERVPTAEVRAVSQIQIG